jgi:hypothetical protein
LDEVGRVLDRGWTGVGRGVVTVAAARQSTSNRPDHGAVALPGGRGLAAPGGLIGLAATAATAATPAAAAATPATAAAATTTHATHAAAAADFSTPPTTTACLLAFS